MFTSSVSRFQVVARSEHEVREPKQSLNGSDHMARRAKTVHKTDLQPSLSETSENLASACSAAFVLSGVLERLQHLEEKMKQVTSNFFPFCLLNAYDDLCTVVLLACSLLTVGCIKTIRSLPTYFCFVDGCGFN